MADFWQVLEKRHCLREFDSKRKVSAELVKKLIYAGHRAPSAGNIHPEKFIVVYEENLKTKIAEAAFEQMFIAEAPAVIVVVADLEKSASRYGERGRNLYAIQDAAAATENIFLAATSLGLAMCWVGAFDEDKIRKILNLPPDLRPLAILPFGWPK